MATFCAESAAWGWFWGLNIGCDWFRVRCTPIIGIILSFFEHSLEKRKGFEKTRTQPVPNPYFIPLNPYFWMTNPRYASKPQLFQTRTKPVPNPYFTRTNPYFFYGFDPPQKCLIFARIWCSWYSCIQFMTIKLNLPLPTVLFRHSTFGKESWGTKRCSGQPSIYLMVDTREFSVCKVHATVQLKLTKARVWYTSIRFKGSLFCYDSQQYSWNLCDGGRVEEHPNVW